MSHARAFVRRAHDPHVDDLPLGATTVASWRVQRGGEGEARRIPPAVLAVTKHYRTRASFNSSHPFTARHEVTAGRILHLHEQIADLEGQDLGVIVLSPRVHALEVVTCRQRELQLRLRAGGPLASYRQRPGGGITAVQGLDGVLTIRAGEPVQLVRPDLRPAGGDYWVVFELSWLGWYVARP